MSDRVLLEKAAKLADMPAVKWCEKRRRMLSRDGQNWCPERNAYQSQRLAWALKLTVDYESGSVWAPGDDHLTCLAVADLARPSGFCRAVVEAAANLHDIYEARAQQAGGLGHYPQVNSRLHRPPQPSPPAVREEGAQ